MGKNNENEIDPEELQKLNGNHNDDLNEDQNDNQNENLKNNENSNLKNNLIIDLKNNQLTIDNKKLNYNNDNNKKNIDHINDEERFFRDMPITEDTQCGFWIFKGPILQKFANKKAYVITYGIVGLIFSMTYAYFNGTITTIEKRFKIPSKNTGLISVGNDISSLFVSAALSYYAGKGHRPRWIGIGLLSIVAFCILTALPHFLYGPGEDAIMLTKEFGGKSSLNNTLEVLEKQRSKSLCRTKAGDGIECEVLDGNLAPQVILFLAQFISGIGGSLYYTLGVSYMDDNIKKSKTPALLSLSYFMRMLGPAIGYALASFCLRIYISPYLTPVITNSDPRWLGAWWMGWIILAGLLIFSGVFLAMFPRQLPRAAARAAIEKEKQNKNKTDQSEQESELPASFKDMIKTFKRLLSNPTLMCNNVASIFYFFGYMPYWIFTPKYIEIQYRQSAATSSLVTGTVALGFSAIGVLLSGFIISKYKPRARYMAAWNVACGAFSVLGMISYAFLGCPGNESSMVMNIYDSSLSVNGNPLPATCNSACQCDYVRYSPVCGDDGNTYISACHAGCTHQKDGLNGKKIYYNCGCIANNRSALPISENILPSLSDNSALTDISPILSTDGGQAVTGACPVDCFKYFVMFLSVMCFLKFIGATGRASNFLVSVRCVPEKDKAVAMGFGLMMMSLLAFIPSPIFFGWILDSLCLVWGKTCNSKGNCWFYDAARLRYILNFIASIFVTIGTILDVGVWYYVKDLKIFDDETKETELNDIDNKNNEEISAEKKTEI